ncbi:MAG TPA: trimeric intracellular cation channel family protein [Rubrobacteraceae bacterium]|nr:trimeric intracellular cation channel family protein [Rubrobacteraceae bacterium]
MSPASVLHALDFFGVAVFAVSGALSAGRKSMDVFGVIVVALVTAIGGGTIRDVLLDRHPVFWIEDPNYLVVILLAAAATIVYTRFQRPPRLSLLVADAFGLALFTVAGAQIAERAGVPSLIVVIMGAITGAAGGLLRDVLCAEIPMVLRRDIYATASLAGAGAYVLLTALGVSAAISGPAAAALIFILRLISIKWDFNAPAYSLDDESG